MTLITVSQNLRKPATAVSNIGHGMEGMFSRSDPMYVGKMDVVMGLAKRDPGFIRFTTDTYIKQFLLTNFGIPLERLEVALTAARKLISVTAEGLKIMPEHSAERIQRISMRGPELYQRDGGIQIA